QAEQASVVCGGSHHELEGFRVAPQGFDGHRCDEPADVCDEVGTRFLRERDLSTVRGCCPGRAGHRLELRAMYVGDGAVSGQFSKVADEPRCVDVGAPYADAERAQSRDSGWVVVEQITHCFGEQWSEPWRPVLAAVGSSREGPALAGSHQLTASLPR